MMELIIALGIVSFLVMYLALNLDQEHFFLKFFLVGFVFVFLFLIPSAVLDSQENCEIVLNYTEDTYIYGNNYSGYIEEDEDFDDVNLFHKNQTYTYQQVCFTDANDTNITFLKTIGWLYRIFITYILVYIIWYFLKKRGISG